MADNLLLLIILALAFVLLVGAVILFCFCYFKGLGAEACSSKVSYLINQVKSGFEVVTYDFFRQVVCRLVKC